MTSERYRVCNNFISVILCLVGDDEVIFESSNRFTWLDAFSTRVRCMMVVSILGDAVGGCTRGSPRGRIRFVGNDSS